MAVTLGGTPIEVSGTFPKVGDTAPDFEAETTQGKIRFHDWPE